MGPSTSIFYRSTCVIYIGNVNSNMRKQNIIKCRIYELQNVDTFNRNYFKLIKDKYAHIVIQIRIPPATVNVTIIINVIASDDLYTRSRT